MIPTLLTDSVTSDLERAVHYTLLWGLEGVELRSVGGPLDRVPHVNEQKVRRRLMESELPALAVTPGMFEGDVENRAEWLNELAILEETLQFCQRLDCRYVLVSSFRGHPEQDDLTLAADALRRAGDRAAKRQIILCVLNTDEGIASTGLTLTRLLDAVDHKSVRAAWDPCTALAAGENPADGVDALAPKVSFVRCRNLDQTGNGWEPRTIDRGAVDWSDQLGRLSRAGFDGPVSLSVDTEPKAKTGLQDATALIRIMRSVRRT